MSEGKTYPKEIRTGYVHHHPLNIIYQTPKGTIVKAWNANGVGVYFVFTSNGGWPVSYFSTRHAAKRALEELTENE